MTTNAPFKKKPLPFPSNYKIINAIWSTDLSFKNLKLGDEIIAIIDSSINPIRLKYMSNGTFVDGLGLTFDTNMFKIIVYTKYPKELLKGE